MVGVGDLHEGVHEPHSDSLLKARSGSVRAEEGRRPDRAILKLSFTTSTPFRAFTTLVPPAALTPSIPLGYEDAEVCFERYGRITESEEKTSRRRMMMIERMK